VQKQSSQGIPNPPCRVCKIFSIHLMKHAIFSQMIYSQKMAWRVSEISTHLRFWLDEPDTLARIDLCTTEVTNFCLANIGDLCTAERQIFVLQILDKDGRKKKYEMNRLSMKTRVENWEEKHIYSILWSIRKGVNYVIPVLHNE